MVSTKKSPAFPQQSTMRDFPGYLSDIPKEDWGGPLVVDNADGPVQAYGLGPYEVGDPKGREFSQGAGTPKTGGNAGGRGQTVRVKGGSR